MIPINFFNNYILFLTVNENETKNLRNQYYLSKDQPLSDWSNLENIMYSVAYELDKPLLKF